MLQNQKHVSNFRQVANVVVTKTQKWNFAFHFIQLN